MSQFPRAVSMGMQLSDPIVKSHSPDQPRRESLYWHHVYEVVTRALDSLAYDVTRWLTNRGFLSFIRGSKKPVNIQVKPPEI